MELKFYSNQYPTSERLLDGKHDPHVAKAMCGFDCGNTIGAFQDDCGEFCVTTPNGYTGICKSCWDKGGYSTAER